MGSGICTRCGETNSATARFCSACGAELGEQPRTAEERRVVSVIFVDLVGFTSRSEQLDPEDVREFLRPYHARVRSELESFGGRVEKFIGDAIMGVFGAPVAYGDDHERAVRAALAVQEWAATDGLEVRVAVNTGEAIVELAARADHGEAMIAGDVVNTAARLQSAAPVGGVLVGHETYGATRTAIEYRPAPPVVAKGKAEPVRAWLAVRPTAPAGERPLTPIPLVGRSRELEVLQRIWQDVATQRRPALVTVFGPAGIGKSRLALELAEHVSELGGRALRGRSTPYGASSPYSAFAQHVKQVARIFDNDELEEAGEKLRSAVGSLVGEAEAEQHTEHLAMLVGLGGSGEAADRETLFFSARVLLESLAAQCPTMLLFEDIHWADGSLLDLIETLAARVRDVPLLLVALARPELRSERPTWGGGLPAYTALCRSTGSRTATPRSSPSASSIVPAPPPSRRRQSRGRARATRSSSRSSRRLSSSARRSTPGSRPASAPSSPRVSTPCLPRRGGCSSTRQSSGASSGAGRSLASHPTRISRARSGRSRNATSYGERRCRASRASSSSPSSTG